MQTYVVNSPDFAVVLIRDADMVVQTGPLLSWSVGREFSSVRRYIESRGWRMSPVMDEEDSHPRWLEIDGCAYELHWKHGCLKRVTQHLEGTAIDLCYEQIPDALKPHVI